MSLSRSIDRAVGALYDNPNLGPGSEYLRPVINGLQRKQARLCSAYALHVTDYATIIRMNPAQLVDLWENDDDLRLLVGREQAYFLYLHRTQGYTISLWSHDGAQVRCVRRKGALYFSHPVLECKRTRRGQKWKLSTQCWSRPSSITRAQNKHLCTSRPNPNASRFTQAASRVVTRLDEQIFRSGYGILFDNDPFQIMMYALFNETIGLSAAGRRTQYVALDARRARRNGRPNKQDGYRTEIHSYPIEKAEIRKRHGVAANHLLTAVDNSPMQLPA